MSSTALGSNTLEMILLDREILTLEELEDAQRKAEAAGSRLERYLVEHSMVSGTDMALALSEYLGMPPIDLNHFTPNSSLTDLISKETMVRHTVVPVARVGQVLTLALGDPFDVMAIEEVQGKTGMHVMAVVAPERQVAEIAQRIAREPEQGLEDIIRDVNEGIV